MSLIEGLLIFFAIILIYALIVYILNKKEVLKKYNVSLYGPALLFRTKKGIGFIKKIASKNRFWKSYGSFSLLFCFIVMVFLVYLFISQTFILFELTPQQKALIPGPEIAFPFPGLNPILPIEYLFYVVLALAIAIIVHEFSHGILGLVGKIKIKSLGMLLLIIPIGAFCEPDEEELKKTEPSKRMRVYAAGPMSNFVVAFIFLLIFSFIFMGAIQPIKGADVLYVYDNTPAKDIGIKVGSVITNFNDTKINDNNEFKSAINNTFPNQTVNISFIIDGNNVNKQVKLANLYDFYDNLTNENINVSLKNTSFLGVGFNPYSGEFISSLKNPLTYEFPRGFLNLYIVPLFGYLVGYNPIASPFIQSYEIVGPLGILPVGLFWAIALSLYWIFWLNLAVGMFNVLPMVPLGGGFLFNDAVGVSIDKIRKDMPKERKEKIVKNISLVVSLLILFLLIFPYLIKYI